MEDPGDICVDEIGESEDLGIFNFVLLGRIVSGNGYSQDEKECLSELKVWSDCVAVR